MPAARQKSEAAALADTYNALGLSEAATGLLEAPCYTRPPEFRGMKVPEILLGGHHAKINAWKTEQSLARTTLLRPDLLGK